MHLCSQLYPFPDYIGWTLHSPEIIQLVFCIINFSSIIQLLPLACKHALILFTLRNVSCHPWEHSAPAISLPCLLQHYLKKLSILPIFSLLPSTYSYHIFIFITPPKSFLPRSLRTNILSGQMGILHCLPILILSGIWHVHHLFLLKTFSSRSSVP